MYLCVYSYYFVYKFASCTVLVPVLETTGKKIKTKYNKRSLLQLLHQYHHNAINDIMKSLKIEHSLLEQLLEENLSSGYSAETIGFLEADAEVQECLMLVNKVLALKAAFCDAGFLNHQNYLWKDMSSCKVGTVTKRAKSVASKLHFSDDRGFNIPCKCLTLNNNTSLGMLFNNTLCSLVSVDKCDNSISWLTENKIVFQDWFNKYIAILLAQILSSCNIPNGVLDLIPVHVSDACNNAKKVDVFLKTTLRRKFGSQTEKVPLKLDLGCLNKYIAPAPADVDELYIDQKLMEASQTVSDQLLLLTQSAKNIFVLLEVVAKVSVLVNMEFDMKLRFSAAQFVHSFLYLRDMKDRCILGILLDLHSGAVDGSSSTGTILTSKLEYCVALLNIQTMEEFHLIIERSGLFVNRTGVSEAALSLSSGNPAIAGKLLSLAQLFFVCNQYDEKLEFSNNPTTVLVMCCCLALHSSKHLKEHIAAFLRNNATSLAGHCFYSVFGKFSELERKSLSSDYFMVVTSQYVTCLCNQQNQLILKDLVNTTFQPLENKSSINNSSSSKRLRKSLGLFFCKFVFAHRTVDDSEFQVDDLETDNSLDNDTDDDDSSECSNSFAELVQEELDMDDIENFVDQEFNVEMDTYNEQMPVYSVEDFLRILALSDHESKIGAHPVSFLSENEYYSVKKLLRDNKLLNAQKQEFSNLQLLRTVKYALLSVFSGSKELNVDYSEFITQLGAILSHLDMKLNTTWTDNIIPSVRSLLLKFTQTRINNTSLLELLTDAYGDREEKFSAVHVLQELLTVNTCKMSADEFNTLVAQTLSICKQRYRSVDPDGLSVLDLRKLLLLLLELLSALVFLIPENLWPSRICKVSNSSDIISVDDSVDHNHDRFVSVLRENISRYQNFLNAKGVTPEYIERINLKNMNVLELITERLKLGTCYSVINCLGSKNVEHIRDYGFEFSYTSISPIISNALRYHDIKLFFKGNEKANNASGINDLPRSIFQKMLFSKSQYERLEASEVPVSLYLMLNKHGK